MLIKMCCLSTILFYISMILFNNFKLNRGSYVSARIVLILLNELGNKDKMRGIADHLIDFPQRV